jgi:S-disulfanyl-L-cysteine oxidoreductase SoxD
MRAGRRFGLAIAIGLVAGGASPTSATPPYFADADNAALTGLGERIYRAHCASCHGRFRQGQPLWQLDDAFAGRRAPALDETGYTWRRSDAAIFRMTKYGRFGGGSRHRPTAMPAFAGVLDDPGIIAVIAFIKAGWPIGLRIAQAMLNPGFAGMPANADDPGWRLPPNCNAMFRRSDAAAQGLR